MNKTLKIILVIGGVVLASVIGFYFLSSNGDSGSKLTTTTGISSGGSGSDAQNATSFLTTLLSLNKIKIDSTLLKSQTFSKLQDNTVPISNDGGVVGRPNPFAPIDNQGDTVSASAAIAFPQISSSISSTPNNTAH